MTSRIKHASLPSKLAITVSLAAFTSLLTMLANVDSALQHGFDTALVKYTTNHPQPAIKQAASYTPTPDRAAADNYAKSEDFWLGHAAQTDTVPVAWTSAPEIGDTLTISSKHGRRILRIEGIASLKTSAGAKSTNTQTPPLFVVTAREAGRPDGFVVRLLVEDAGMAALRRNGVVVDHNL